MITPETVLATCVVGFTAVAAVLDYRTHRLPNALTMAILAAGLVFHATIGFLSGGLAVAGWNLLFSLGGFAAGFGVLLILWLIGGGGGGDVKFMGALGAWLGPAVTLHVFVVSAVLVMLLMLGLLILSVLRGGWTGAKKQLREQQSERIAQRQKEGKPIGRRVIPFGVPVAMATWLVLAFHMWRG